MLTLAPHPSAAPAAFVTTFAAPLDGPSPTWLTDLLQVDAAAPLRADDTVRAAVRDMLRHGGFKPTGRSKPASEYLIKAAEGGFLGGINLAVDACNAVSLHSGLPISVVDLDRARPPFHIGLAPAEARYVFNAGGQELDLGGLLCLSDADGPCANAVKDAQRTKTSASTVRTLSIVWGVASDPGRTEATVRWYRGLLAQAGATTEAWSGAT